MDDKGNKINTQLLGVPLEKLPICSVKGSEIVRRQFMSHLRDVMVSIRPDGIQFNTSCIRKLEDVLYVHFLVLREKRWLIIRACDGDDKDSQRWCNVKNGIRVSRGIKGRDFSILMYRMMGWNRGYYYKVSGTPALQEDDRDVLLMVFELDAYERYPLTTKGRAAAGVDNDEVGEQELLLLNEIEERKAKETVERKAAREKGEQPKRRKSDRVFPDSWKEDTFGLPIEQHTSRVRVPRLNELQEQLTMFGEKGDKQAHSEG
jgi:hypothetical protein